MVTGEEELGKEKMQKVGHTCLLERRSNRRKAAGNWECLGGWWMVDDRNQGGAEEGKDEGGCTHLFVGGYARARRLRPRGRRLCTHRGKDARRQRRCARDLGARNHRAPWSTWGTSLTSTRSPRMVPPSTAPTSTPMLCAHPQPAHWRAHPRVNLPGPEEKISLLHTQTTSALPLTSYPPCTSPPPYRASVSAPKVSVHAREEERTR